MTIGLLLPVLERFFPDRRSKQRKEYTLSLVRKIAILYTQLPEDPKTYVDGPCSGNVNTDLIPVLDEFENDFLSLDGAGTASVRVQISARGDENWIGFSINGRRIKMLQKEEEVELHFEEKRESEWENILIKQVGWGRLGSFLDYIESEIIE